ncbi:MAG: hypothetical protein M3011_00055 [Actinomycetota bacterium]|nr:hypothetical protein [Actinomycetota bacterium]
MRGINAGPYTGWTTAGSANSEFAYDAYSSEFGLIMGSTTNLRQPPVQKAHDAIALPGGQALLVGEVSGDAGLVRQNADGSIDAGFGNAGKVMSDLVSYPTGAVAEAGGRIVVFGSDSSSRSVIGGFLADGRPDPAFGTHGRTVVARDGHRPSRPSLAVVAGGGLLVATGDDNHHVVLSRFSADGIAHPAFGTGGVIANAWASESPSSTRLTAQPDGKVLAYGFDDGVHRMNADGTPDGGFGPGGVVRLPLFGAPNGFPAAVALEPDGKILIGAAKGSQPFVARYLADGSPDPARALVAAPGGLDLQDGGDLLRATTPSATSAWRSSSLCSTCTGRRSAMRSRRRPSATER